MWIILLDHSSSMGEPFSGEVSQRPPGRVRQVVAGTKWEAAKDAVVNEVTSLGSEEQICLIAFTSNASVVFEGTASQSDELRASLDGLSPENGTDIAAALRAARAYAAGSGPTHVSVEVISDGLSELKPAQEAAQALAERAGLIDVFLMDPTPEGQAVAKAIAVRGRVTSVVSAPELSRKASQAAKRHAAEAERAESALAKADTERQAVVGGVPSRERLAFSAGYPPAVRLRSEGVFRKEVGE